MLKLQLRLCTVLAMCLMVCLSEAVHFDHFSQRAQSKSTTKQNRLPEMLKATTVAAKQQVTEKPILSAKHKPENPKKTVGQLQLEIQELEQMQNQLEHEISKGKDKSKEKLLHHIKTQIHVRQIRIKHQNQKEPLLSQHPSNESKIRNELLNRDKTETTGKHQKSQQAAHGSELLQTLNKTNDFPREHMSQQAKTNNIMKINYTAQVPEVMALQQKHYHQQDSRNFILTDNPRQPHNSNGVLVTHKQHMQPLQPQLQHHQQQQQYHIPQTFPEKVVQHQTIDTAPLRQEQVNLIGQPAITMNRAIFQPGTQQILVPINALPINNVFPSQILPNERIIVIEAVSNKYGQTRDTENSLVVKSDQQILQKIPLATESTPTLQTNQVTTTTSPTTTSALTTTASTTTTTTAAAVATSSHTTMPAPPTTYSYLEETTPADADSFKKEFYKGEIRRQKLEIKKLQLEIRALQRSEFESFSPHRGGGENEDAPPRPRIRFAARGMPFPFFKRK